MSQYLEFLRYFILYFSFRPENVLSSEDFFSDKYKMSYPNRGKALIINNRHFDRRLNLGERTGTDVDAIALHQRFGEMGFEAEVVDNLTIKEMGQILAKGEFRLKYIHALICIKMVHFHIIAAPTNIY